MTTRVSVAAVVLVAFVAGACKDPLTAENLNNDVIRVFATGVLSDAVRVPAVPEYGKATMTAQLASMALRLLQLGNFNMGLRAAIPRAPILNNKSAQQSNNGVFSAWSRQGRLQSNALKQLTRFARRTASAVVGGRPSARWASSTSAATWVPVPDLRFAGIMDHLMASDSCPG